MKWALISSSKELPRYQALSEFLNSHGKTNELHFVECQQSNFKPCFDKAMKEFDQIRVESPFGQKLHELHLPRSAVFSTLRSGDALIFENGQWWPYSFLHEAFLREFTLHTKNLNLDSNVMIVGAGAAARAIVGALVRIGFQRFNITDRDESSARRFINDLKISYFNIRMEFIPGPALMMLPGSNSVMINSTPLREDNNILKHLYYFNFLKTPATIIDLTLVPPNPPLIQEAEKLGMSVLRGTQIASQSDCLWMQRVFQLSVSPQEYLQFLEEKLSAIPFDPTPFVNTLQN